MSLGYRLKWCFLQLDDIRWQNHITHGPCCFRHQGRLCHLILCRFRNHVTWSHFAPWIACIPPEPHKILKTHRIFILFVYFMGNYVTCKKYIKKWQSGFINFMSTHLELTAKSYVAIGTGTLLHYKYRCQENCIFVTLSKVQKILQNATRSENTFQSFNIEVYEKFFFQLSF